MHEYKGLTIYTHSEVYEPGEDTFLFLDNLKLRRSDEVLEIGTGTGLIAIYAAQKAKNVVATDINEHAIRCALKNTISNKIYNVELKQGHLFEPVEGMKFDLILFNAPYLPTDENEKLDNELNAAFDGGKDGRAVIDAFIRDVKNYLKKGGRFQLVQSSLADNQKTLSKLKKLGFKCEIIAVEKCFFEEIVVISGEIN